MTALERKEFGFGLKADQRSATGDVAVFGQVDLDREIIVGPVEGKVPLLEAHDWSRRPVGIADIRSDAHRARAAIDFLDTAAGREAHQTVKQLHAAGVPQRLSIGFRTEKARLPTDEERARGAIRILEKISPVELSLVLLGAQPGARITTVKCTACAARESGVQHTAPRRAKAPARNGLSPICPRHGRAACDCPDPKIAALVAEGKAILARGKVVLESSQPLVPPAHRALAERALEWGCARLQISNLEPSLRFDRWADGAWGKFYKGAAPRTVYISADVPVDEIPRVVFHELGHLDDYRRGFSTDECTAEVAERWLLNHWNEESRD